MNHAKPLVSLIFAAALTAGCAGGAAKTAEDYNQALADAKSAVSKAKKAKNEWRDTGKILKKAAAAAKAGDYDKATKLANKAKRQGELALIQANAQKNAGPM